MKEPEERDEREEGEALLEAIAMGDLAVDDERVRARASADPEFARELESTLMVQASLDDIGDLVRSGGQTPESDVPDLEAARSLLHELRSGGEARDTLQTTPAVIAERGGARRVRSAVLGSLAAAALVLVFWRPWRSAETGARPSDVYLGTEEILSDLRPRGSVKSIESFRWTASRGEVFDIEVRDPASGELLDSDRELSETIWIPDAIRPGTWPAGWPDTIQWQVTVSDSSDLLIDSKIERVERSLD